ncbi:MAG: hypothetical protein EOM03_14695 [Clostridia bacterium]|nr:hypothetical protein [Clostridia bacterium]
MKDLDHEPSTKYLTDRGKEIINSFPGLTQEELDAANDLFSHNIIYETVKSGRHFWTSCCHKELSVDDPPRTSDQTLRDVLYGRHNDFVICPWCGKPATLKCKGKFKGGRTTYADGQVLFLKAYNGGIFAQGYWMNKDYLKRPAAYPHYCVSAVYWFEAGKAVQFTTNYGSWYSSIESGSMHRKKEVGEPFNRGGMYPGVIPYAVIGIDELDKSFARYCDYSRFRYRDAPGAVLYDDLIRFLTVAAVYPRQLEMLNKAGQLTLIKDLMWTGKKNAKIFTWEEADPRRAFGIDGQELKKYLALGDTLGVLDVRKMLNCSIEKANEWFSDLYGFDHSKAVERFYLEARRRGLTADELRKYLLRFTGWRCHGQGLFTVACAYQLWMDYLANAETVGFDLGQRNVLLPRDLEGAHDNAAALVLARKETEDKKKREQTRKTKLRAKELDKWYGFETEHYFIRAPRSAAEIVEEGRGLSHCVGGYADRHVNGAVTILFLRDKAYPNTPLCTIQVDGDRLVQIHGYDDERQKGAIKPSIRFAEIYEPWYAWLKAGQPRKKDGTPAVPKPKTKKKKEKAA